MDRRKFFKLVGVGGLASSLPWAIAACGGGSSTTATDAPPATADTTATTVAQASDGAVIGSVGDLDANGFILNEDLENGVMVIRNPSNPDNLIAVDPTCPHAQCVVDWEAGTATFVCPCHDSAFEPSGALIADSGPATTGLPTYPVVVDGDQIKLAG